MVGSNDILYKPGEKPDHVIVIKYVPYVGKYEISVSSIETFCYTKNILTNNLVPSRRYSFNYKIVNAQFIPNFRKVG